MRRRRLGLLTAALCLGGALTACGDGNDGEGYAAVGARGGASPGGAAAPSGPVRLVPLDGPSASGTTSSTSRPQPEGTEGGEAPGTGTRTGSATVTLPGAEATGPTVPGATAPPLPAPGTPGSPGAPPSTPNSPPAPRPPGTTPPPPGPALLTLSVPQLADGDRRWCERVTLTFRNTGGMAAASGTVAFETHIIGALGVDWATIGSTQPLPSPIAAGTAKQHTYTVCVESWRVPLGMRIDTQKVTATWK
ncbi:hypothetical protein ACGFMM_28840 [Streptomyces sp. NPDC048604]|uniref:hypothetical protein n=1 Tax=Streptomyces sp. NPDC048604 TaxID=3365578 RepID=UPI0037191DFF